MPNKLLISYSGGETRAALVESNRLAEFQIERKSASNCLGNIYLGKVQRIMPGMQAAFIDIGLETAGFLHQSEILPTGKDLSSDIQQSLHQGQMLIVQVTKPARDGKGPVLTCYVSISSRFLAYMPHNDQVAVSHRITDAGERTRLLGIANDLAVRHELSGGLILRTAAEGGSVEDIERDIRYLQHCWQKIAEGKKAKPAELSGKNKGKRPVKLLEDLPLALRVLREIPQAGLDAIQFDNEDQYLLAKEFAKSYCSNISALIEYIEVPNNLFGEDIEAQVEAALERKVALGCGGNLIIEQTEAMVSIDVNTAGFVGKNNLQDTILRTNLEAVAEVARQLRLRNLGGIIVIDLIDMESQESRKSVLAAFEDALLPDRSRTKVVGISALGLLEMTRKRDSHSLVGSLCEPCGECSGAGVVKSLETIGFELYRDIVMSPCAKVAKGESRLKKAKELRVLMSAELMQSLSSKEPNFLQEITTNYPASIDFRVDNELPRDGYDILLT